MKLLLQIILLCIMPSLYGAAASSAEQDKKKPFALVASYSGKKETRDKQSFTFEAKKSAKVAVCMAIWAEVDKTSGYLCTHNFLDVVIEKFGQSDKYYKNLTCLSQLVHTFLERMGAHELTSMQCIDPKYYQVTIALGHLLPVKNKWARYVVCNEYFNDPVGKVFASDCCYKPFDTRFPFVGWKRSGGKTVDVGSSDYADAIDASDLMRYAINLAQANKETVMAIDCWQISPYFFEP